MPNKRWIIRRFPSKSIIIKEENFSRYPRLNVLGSSLFKSKDEVVRVIKELELTSSKAKGSQKVELKVVFTN
jgi:hypothetical protein